MRDDELTLLSESLAGLVRDVVTKEVTTLLDCIGEVDTQLRTELGTVRERMAGLEARTPEPGPPGPPGPAGADGKDGVNGKDGSPGLRYRYVWKPDPDDGHGPYVKGDIVTYAGGGWHCNADGPTGKPGETKDWSLFVKPGRDYGHRGK